MEEVLNQEYTTPIQEVRKYLTPHFPEVPIMSRTPAQEPQGLYIIVTQGIPVNTATVLDITPVFIRVVSDDLGISLDAINHVRRLMWKNSLWEEFSGVHETPDADKPDLAVWQISGFLTQAIH